MPTQRAPYRRVFYCDRLRNESDSWDMLALGISDEFDDIAGAELEVRQPTTSHTDGHGPHDSM